MTSCRILNIHGYGGSPENCARNALCELGQTVVSPAIDYDTQTPEQIADRLREIIAQEQIGLLCGTSLGGFFAAVLAAETGLPVLLVNPCLLPFLHLPRLGYSHDAAGFIPLFSKLVAIDRHRVGCIVGGSDEIIDTHDFAEHLLKNAYFRVIPDGKHSGATLPLTAYFSEVLPQIVRRQTPLRVQVYSREQIGEIIAAGSFPPNTAVISFYDPPTKRGGSYDRVDYGAVCKDVYYCETEDLDLSYLAEKGYTYESFLPDAAEIAAFIRRAYAGGLDIICQCDYGESRSAGCAAAILEYYERAGMRIFADYKYYPNQVVYHKIYDALSADAP